MTNQFDVTALDSLYLHPEDTTDGYLERELVALMNGYADYDDHRRVDAIAREHLEKHIAITVCNRAPGLFNL